MWMELSQCLGYDVSIVKDRMVQIRNKYHLEKKRLENLKFDNPNVVPEESKWPLYEQLAFLSDHIPVRRSFRTMRCKRKYSESEFVVKSEPESDLTDIDRGRDYEYKPGRKEPPTFRRNNGNPASKKYRFLPYSSARYNAQPPPRIARLPRQIYASSHAKAVYQRRTPQPIQSPSPENDKYQAFGQFLTSALIELPETEALLLVDQFTTEIVQAYMTNNVENENQADNDGDLLEAVPDCNGHGSELITE